MNTAVNTMDSRTVTTPRGRVSYPALFKARVNDDGTAKFEITLVFDKAAQATPAFAAMKKAAAEAFSQAVTKLWGGKKPPNVRSPFRDGAEKDDPDVYPPGSVFVGFRSDRQPGVVDGNLNAVIDPYKVYAGCFALVNAQAYAYDRKGNKGVTFGLNHVQFLEDGPAIGASRPSPESVFAKVDGTAAPAAAQGGDVDPFS